MCASSTPVYVLWRDRSSSRKMMKVVALFICALLHGTDGFGGGGAGIAATWLRTPRAHLKTASPRQRTAQPSVLRCSLNSEHVPVCAVQAQQLSTKLVGDQRRQDEIEKCMEQYDAVYTILWKKEGDGPFRVAGEYTIESRRRCE